MGQALRLASSFVVLDNKFKADTVEVTQDLYERLDDEFVILVSGEGTVNAETPVRSRDR